MHELRLIKADGRALTLYSRQPIPAIDAAATLAQLPHAQPHFRWHPLRGEWVAYAAYRQNRTFLPPPDFDPLRPSADPLHPTELPVGEYDVAVFENRFPCMELAATERPATVVASAPANGVCEVVVFTQDADTSLGRLPLSHLELLLKVWGRRTAALEAIPHIRYVLPFENRGVEVGVTLHHPHGQIYAYPFLPPLAERAAACELEHFRSKGVALIERHIDLELESGERILYAGPHAVAFVPAHARYPYEVWVAPRRATPGFGALDAAQRSDLACALKTALLKYDGLWERPMPYVMAWYQAPARSASPAAHHLHAEFYPAYRTRDRLKYLAGTELAAGMFANDALPEEAARELQAVRVVV